MKKIVSMILAITLIMSLGSVVSANEYQTLKNDVPVFSSIEERVASGDTSPEFIIRNNNPSTRSTGASARYVYSKTVKITKNDWGYHPSFTTWQVVDGYFFSNSSTVNMSVSITIYGVISIGVDKSASGGNLFITADRTKGASRVKVGGAVALDLYDVYLYDSMGKLITINRGTYKEFNKSKTVYNYFPVYK